MTTTQYLNVLRRYKILILASALVGLLLAGGWTVVRHEPYQATAKAYVSANSATSLQDLTQGSSFSQQAVSSFADVATTPFVLNAVIRKLDLRTTTQDLAKRIDVESPVNTVVLQVSAEDANETQAVRIANAVTFYLSSAVSNLTPTTSDGSPQIRLTQIQDAGSQIDRLGPPSVPLIIAGGAAGAVLGLFLALGIAVLRNRVVARDDLTELTDAPLLGTVSHGDNVTTYPLAVTSAEGVAPRRFEQYHTIRTNLRWSSIDKQARVIVVTSSVPGEGKTTSVANLALALSSVGSSVLAIDADLRRPKLAEAFGLESTLGLTDVLTSVADLQTCLQQWGDGTLSILPSGPIPPNPNELVQSSRMSELIATVADAYDYVLIDSPPLLAVSDAAVLAKQADGTLLIVGSSIVRKRQMASSLALLEQLDIHVVGTVLNGLKSSDSTARDYYVAQYAYTAK